MWVKATPDGTPPLPIRRFATLNVLSDSLTINILNGSATLQHKLRYQHILCLSQDLDADVLCLNEVSTTFLTMLKGDPHVRSEYFLSSVEFAEMSTAHFGNVVMCKTLPNVFAMIPQPLLSRKAILVGFNHANIAFCTTHLQANIGKTAIRKSQLAALADEVAKVLPPRNIMDVVILGDLNFHSETENASIPTGYVDLWTDLRYSSDKGAATLTSETNAMVQFVAAVFGVLRDASRQGAITAARCHRPYIRLHAHLGEQEAIPRLAPAVAATPLACDPVVAAVHRGGPWIQFVLSASVHFPERPLWTVRGMLLRK